MLANMPGWLYREWETYNEFEPISHPQRVEWMLAKLIAIMTKRKHQPIKPDLFMPQYGPPKPVKPMKSQAIYNMMRGWAVKAGAKDPRI